MAKQTEPPEDHGHTLERQNICEECGGPLRDGTGTFGTRLISLGQNKAYAAPVCLICKRKGTKK